MGDCLMISGRVPGTIAFMGCSFHPVQCNIHRSTDGKDNCDHDLSWVVWDERRFTALMALHGRSGCEVTCVRSVSTVGPVGFGERGFDLFCWLSRVLVSPAGSIGSVETLKKISIHPSRTWRRSSPYPPHVHRIGGHCSTLLYPPSGRAPPYLSKVRHKRRDIR